MRAFGSLSELDFRDLLMLMSATEAFFSNVFFTFRASFQGLRMSCIACEGERQTFDSVVLHFQRK